MLFLLPTVTGVLVVVFVILLGLRGLRRKQFKAPTPLSHRVARRLGRRAGRR